MLKSYGLPLPGVETHSSSPVRLSNAARIESSSLVGDSVATAWDDLYFLHRACQAHVEQARQGIRLDAGRAQELVLLRSVRLVAGRAVFVLAMHGQRFAQSPLAELALVEPEALRRSRAGEGDDREGGSSCLSEP